MAKVQEAKETPSVKVLDTAMIPEKKSFTHRGVIVLLGTFTFFAFSIVWVLGTAHFKEADPRDPRILFIHEVAGWRQARLKWLSRNGIPPQSAEYGFEEGRGDRSSIRRG